MKLNYLKDALKTFTLIGLLTLVGCSNNEDEIIIEETNILASISYGAKSVGTVITIKAVNGKYMSSENGAQNMTTNRSTPQSWEKFTVVDAGGGYIGLKASNNKFVCSEQNGAQPLIANRNSIGGDWEKFKFVATGSEYAILAKSGKYVCAENGGSSSPIANRNSIGGWEKFTIEVVGGDGGGDDPTTGGGFDFGGEFNIETSDNCGSDTGTDTKNYVTLANNTSVTQDGLKFFENINGNYILQSCDQDGTRTEWKQSTRFSLNNSRKMSYSAKFYDYPSAGVTIAQVHNRGGAGRPLLRVEIASGEIHFVIVDTHVKGQGSSHTVVGPDYTEGSYLNLSIQTGSDKIIAYVSTTNGSKTVTYTKNNSNDDYSINNKWYESGVSKNGINLADGFYFKAGVYNDSGNNSDHPKGEFTSFNYEN